MYRSIIGPDAFCSGGGGVTRTTGACVGGDRYGGGQIGMACGMVWWGGVGWNSRTKDVY